MITVEGAVTALDLNATPPTLQLRLSFGPVSTLIIEPTTTVFKGGQLWKLEDVRIGDDVKVLYRPKEGQHLITSIEIERPPSQTKNSLTEGSAVDVPRASR